MSTITFELNGKPMTATLKENVPFNKLLEAVANGVAICYDDDGAFRPELVDFAIEYECLSVLTDIKLGTSVSTAWKYIRAIDGVPSVDADFIADGIRAQINYRNRMVVATVQSSGVRELAERLDRITAGVEQTMASFSKLLDTAATDLEKNSNVDLQAIADAVKDGNFTEERVASAVLNFQEAQKKKQAKAVKPKKATEPVKE